MAHPALTIVQIDDVDTRDTRIWTAAPPELIKAIDDYHHDNRYKTRSAAVRQLIEYGLEYARNKRMT